MAEIVGPCCKAQDPLLTLGALYRDIGIIVHVTLSAKITKDEVDN